MPILSKELDQTISVDLKTSPESLAFGVSPHIIVLQELLGYNISTDGLGPVPIWGKRLGIYHPITSELIEMDEHDWRIFDLLNTGFYSVSQIAALIHVDGQTVQETLSEMINHLITVRENFRVELTPVLPTTQEVEVYMETTEMCNFGCIGCAVGMDRMVGFDAKTMDTEMAKRILYKIVCDVEQKGINRIRIKWAGGEAMIPAARTVFRECQPYIQLLRTQYPHIDISQVVLTNGSFLDDETVSLLASSGSHVSISLWGVGLENDRIRRIRRKKDTFENIREGLGRLHKAGVSFNINHVITPDNAESFSDMVYALWDPSSESFIGRDWQWQGEMKPIPMGISFFRPQTIEQLNALKAYGYKKMVNGIRKGFQAMCELIQRKVPIQSLGKIDYLQLFDVIPSSCGTGFNYIAIGPNGVASCHEALYGMDDNSSMTLDDSLNILNLANAEYEHKQHQLLGLHKAFPEVDGSIQLVLALHGGVGCPRTMKVEQNGDMKLAASTAHALYEPLVSELLALETMRRKNLQ